MKYLLLLSLFLYSCKEIADYGNSVKQENIRQFDSINKALEASSVEMMSKDKTHSDSLKRVMDSLLDNTESGRIIKKAMMEEDSIEKRMME